MEALPPHLWVALFQRLDWWSLDQWAGVGPEWSVLLEDPSLSWTARARDLASLLPPTSPTGPGHFSRLDYQRLLHGVWGDEFGFLYGVGAKNGGGDHIYPIYARNPTGLCIHSVTLLGQQQPKQQLLVEKQQELKLKFDHALLSPDETQWFQKKCRIGRLVLLLHKERIGCGLSRSVLIHRHNQAALRQHLHFTVKGRRSSTLPLPSLKELLHEGDLLLQQYSWFRY